MEWSLTQSKLLAFHRLMRTDKPIGALLLLGRRFGRYGWRRRVCLSCGFWQFLSLACG